jgi:hypothetical protein
MDQSFERFLRNTRSPSASAIRTSCICDELGIADDHAYLAMEYFPRAATCAGA